MKDQPDFIIIGAMKCATSSLHEQLARQPGIFMTQPKEPNFFSDDDAYARGMAWYRSLFEAAPDGALCGESSTHYTKRQTFPQTVERIKKHLNQVNCVYLMRHPIDRLVSHYVHDWTMRKISVPIDSAIDQYPELIDYGLYSTQLQPYAEAFGRDRILPLFFEQFVTRPQDVLESVCRFIGYEHRPQWDATLGRQNASDERMRTSPMRDALVNAPGLSTIRRRLVPPGVRNRVKKLWCMNSRPEISPRQTERLKKMFDEDLAVLGTWLGVSLSCDQFRDLVTAGPLTWANGSEERVA